MIIRMVRNLLAVWAVLAELIVSAISTALIEAVVVIVSTVHEARGFTQVA